MGELVGLGVLLAVGLAVAVAVVVLVAARDAVRPPRHTAGFAAARGLPLDPGDQGHAYEAWTLDAPDGVRLAVWEIEGRGQAGTAVLVHDWGASRIEMLGRLEPWCGTAARLVLYDLRGHGESGGSSRLGDREELDLLALLERLGGGPFVLVGFGLGAGIARRAADAGSSGASDVVAAEPERDADDVVRASLKRIGVPLRPFAYLVRLALRALGIRPPGGPGREASNWSHADKRPSRDPPGA